MTQLAYELRSKDTGYGHPPSIELLNNIQEVQSALRSRTGGSEDPAFVELYLHHARPRRLATTPGVTRRLRLVFELPPDPQIWLSALADELHTSSTPGIRRRDQALAAIFADVRAALSEFWLQRPSQMGTTTLQRPEALNTAEISFPTAPARHAQVAAEVRALAGVSVERVASMLGVSPKSYYRWLNGEPISQDHRSQLHYLHALLSDAARRLGQPTLLEWLFEPIDKEQSAFITPIQLLQAGRFQEVYDYVTALPDPQPVAEGTARGLLRRAPANSEDWG